MNDTQPDAAPPPCPNCGDPRPGNFCPNCGQRRGDRRVTLRRLIADAVEDQFSLNGTLPRTLGVLLTRPGRLTSDYMGGRIACYIPPFRLYLLSSFLFFLVLSISDGGNLAITRSGDDVATDTAAVTEPLPAELARARADSMAAERLRNAAQVDSAFDAGDLDFLPEFVRQRARERFRMLAMREERALGEAFRREMLDRLPIAVFLLLPLFAGLLKLLYVRRGRFYVEHFVFALHIHAFAYIAFTALQLLEQWAWPRLALGLWLLVYVFLALKRFYQQSVWKTALKYLVLAAVYGILLGAVMVAMLILVLLTAPL